MSIIDKFGYVGGRDAGAAPPPLTVRDLIENLSGVNDAWQDAPVLIEGGDGKPVAIRRVTLELRQPGNHPQVVVVPPGFRSWR